MFYVPQVPLLFPERVANEDNFLKIVQEQMTGPIPFIGNLAPTWQNLRSGRRGQDR